MKTGNWLFIAIKKLYGEDKGVCLIWHYLAHNQKVCSRRTNEQLSKLKQETRDLIKEIENSLDFPGKKSILCDWCEYKEICPMWNPNSPHQTSINKKQTKLNDKKYNPFHDIEIEKQDDNNKNNSSKKLDIWD